MGLFSRHKKSDSFEEIPEALDRPSHTSIGLFEAYMSHDKPLVIVTHERQMAWKQENRYVIAHATTGQPALVPSFKFWKNGTLPREITDPSGSPLFNFKMKLMSMTHTFHGLSPQDPDEVMFTIKNTSSWTKMKMTLTFTNAADGKPVEITLNDHGSSGSIMYKCRGTFSLTSEEGCPVIGTLTPQPPGFVDPDSIPTLDEKNVRSYYLAVAPGVDAALLQAMCLCLDEVRILTKSAAAGAASSSAAASASVAAAVS